MSQGPSAGAKRVFWIVDNGSAHRGQKAADRLTAAFPNTVMVHTPMHASWRNQVGSYFSAVQRKALSPHGFIGSTEVRDRLRAFEDRKFPARKAGSSALSITGTVLSNRRLLWCVAVRGRDPRCR